MADDLGTYGVIHPRSLESAIGESEPAWFDDVDADPKTGCEAQDRADISGDIRLVESYPHAPADMRMYRNAAIFIKWDWQSR